MFVIFNHIHDKITTQNNVPLIFANASQIVKIIKLKCCYEMLLSCVQYIIAIVVSQTHDGEITQRKCEIIIHFNMSANYQTNNIIFILSY